ncbi:ABC transporter permease [Pseudonocardia humida]|uniref:Transport permease protein n=1 Tax=Pseudonocardia humida TaxID=2800819 RepID=A0ABT1A382_9PSEU|nr:ABC transporter permease [Pseudonocardia humida]MCO1657259.1 ABC transporter permease [Pseudonocardia humida]
MTAAGLAPLPSALPLGLARGALEVKRFFRSREAVVFTFSLPTVLMVLLGSVFGDHGEPAGVTSSQVLAAGMIAAGIMSTTFVSLGTDIAGDRDDGTLKRLRGTPMPAAAYFIGKIVLVAVTTVAQIALMLAVAMALFGLTLPATVGDWLTFGWVFALGVTSCSLLGIAISSTARNARSANAITQIPYLALQFVSGVFVTPITALPDGLVTTASFFPVKWMAQGFRSVFLPDSMAAYEPAGTWELDRVALVLGAWCVIGLVLCLTTFRWRRGQDG